MEIELNGAPRRVSENHSLQALVEELDLTDKAVAVAVNREVVPKAKWAERMLAPYDRVDIVRAIGGG